MMLASPSPNTARRKSGAGFSPLKKNRMCNSTRTEAPQNTIVRCPFRDGRIRRITTLHSSPKAQVTIFIFIAILVILLVGFFSIVGIQGISPSSSPAKSAKQFVEMCFNEASECALYAAGKRDGIIPDLVVIEDDTTTAIGESTKTCLGSNHFSQDVAVTSITPLITFNEKTRITSDNDIAVRQENEEITIDDYKETFDVPFKEMYREAVQLKSGAKPDGVPESFIKLDSSFDVDAAEQDGQKIISLAGGEVKKQYYRFTLVK